MTDNNSFVTVTVNDNTSTRQNEATIRSVFKLAYAAELDSMKAIPAPEVLQIKLDIDDMVTTGIGVAEKIRAFRDEAAKLYGFDITNFDRLESRFLALREAETQYDNACKRPDNLEPMAERAYTLREMVRAEVEAAIVHGFINREAVKDVTAVRGYKIVASDLLTLNGALIEAWPRLQGRGFLTRDKIEEAESLAAKILAEVARREQASAVMAATSDIRARAYTLALNTYDQVQRAIGYLRWGKDADEIVPSLFAGRNKRRAEPEEPVAPSTPEPAPAASNNNPGGSPFIE